MLLALGSDGAEAAGAMAFVQLLANGPLQQIVQPFAMGAALGIHPLAVLIVTIAGGALFGTVGLIVAAPVVAAMVKISADLAGARAELRPRRRRAGSPEGARPQPPPAPRIVSSPNRERAMEHLSHHHRNALREIFDHQRTNTVEWRKVHGLLESIGAIDEEHDDKLKVTIGPETEVLRVPKGKELDAQAVVDLRRMLTEAGYGPGEGTELEDERDRDHGDSRWGEPT